jgi:hypothetical protein
MCARASSRSSTREPGSALMRRPSGAGGAGLRLTFAALAAVSLRCSSAGGSHGTAAEETSGCYQLRVTNWQPPLQLGGDLQFVLPPDRIHLTLERPERAWRKGSYVVTPAPGSRDTIYTSGEWLVSGGRVEILWTTGFSGLTMELSAGRNGLRGTARTFWDFPRPTQTAAVEGTPVPCPSDRGD